MIETSRVINVSLTLDTDDFDVVKTLVGSSDLNRTDLDRKTRHIIHNWIALNYNDNTFEDNYTVIINAVSE